MTIHRTEPGDAALHPLGWAHVPGTDVDVSALSLVDTTKALADGTPLFARLSDEDLKIAAKRLGGRMLRRSTMLAMKEAADIIIEPITMKHTQSLAGSKNHDKRFWVAISEYGGLGGLIILGDGKWHLHTDKVGKAKLGGWWTENLEKYSQTRRGPGWVQLGTGEPHVDGLFDYGTLSRIERDHCPREHVDDPPPASEPSLPAITKHGDVDPGTRGNRVGPVTDLQTFLKNEGEPYASLVGSVDGWHGQDTTDALRRFIDDNAPDSDTYPPDTDSDPDTMPESGLAVALRARLAKLTKPFRQAKSYGKGRPRGPACGTTLHTAEIAEVSYGAENLQSWAATGPGVSWTDAVDDDSICPSVRIEDRCWAAGPGNDRHVHVEIAGRASQTKKQWSDTYSEATLDNVCLLVAARHVDNGWSIKRLSADDLLAGDFDGICDHRTWSDASQRAKKENRRDSPWWNPARSKHRTTNHRDVGSHFPWEMVLAKVAEYAAILRGA